MTKSPEITPRQRVLFALSKLGPSVQSAVLADGALSKRWDIGTQRPIEVAKGLVVHRNVLFSVFQHAADGLSVPALIDENGVAINATVSMDAEGSALIESGKLKLRFSHAVLMSAEPARRLAALEAIFSRLTLSLSEQKRLRGIVARPGYGADDFLEVAQILTASPDEYSDRLRERVAVRQVAHRDVLPEEEAHWQNLTAPRSGSETLTQFMETELAAERQARLTRNTVAGFRSIALTFSSPALVPHALFDTLTADALIQALEEACTLDDHFALVGAFEICARHLDKDPRCTQIGEKLLERLLGKMERLQTSCGMFGFAFVLAAAALAEDENLKGQPAYWRRLAAASHASLVVRTCGVTEIDHEGLFKWAVMNAGESYTLSVLTDFSTDPRWRPEWITHSFMVADAVGRVLTAFMKIPGESAPATWDSRIETAKTWVQDQHMHLMTNFPAIMEGGRPVPEPKIADMGALAEPYARLMGDPNVENLLVLTPAIHAFGFPPEALESLHAVLDYIRRHANGEDDDLVVNALKLLAQIAVMASNVKLADAVADACMERMAEAKQRSRLLDLIFRLVECAAADPDRIGAKSTLARRLEQACYIFPGGALSVDVIDLLELMKIIDPSLEQRLGRAIAFAKLGASRANAA